MERIIIKDFGPIEYIDMPLDKQFNVIIGEQATGKSTIVKWINYFSKIAFDFQRVFFSMLKPGIQLDVDKVLHLAEEYGVKRVYDYFGASFFEDTTVVRYYFYDNYYAEVFQENGITKLLYSGELEKSLKKVIQEMCVIVGNYSGNVQALVSLQGQIFYKWNEVFCENWVVFLPAGRSNVITSITPELDVNISEISQDVCIQQFITDVKLYKNIYVTGYFQQFLKKHFESSDKYYREFQELEQLQMKVLNGKYLMQDGNDYIELTNKKLVPMIFASSGQQETVWVMNILGMKAYENLSSVQSGVLIIEEPEAHLYPTAQLDIVKYMVLVAKMTHSKLFITTHSPYILSAINLLVHSGSVEDKLEKLGKKYEEVVSKPFRISEKLTSAYKLLRRNGHQEMISILPKESDMIDFAEIDEVSDEINMATDRLIDLEINNGL